MTSYTLSHLSLSKTISGRYKYPCVHFSDVYWLAQGHITRTVRNQVWIQYSKFTLPSLCCVILITHYTFNYGKRKVTWIKSWFMTQSFTVFHCWATGALRILTNSPTSQSFIWIQAGTASRSSSPTGGACRSSEALARETKLISSSVSFISEATYSLQLIPSGKFLENLMWNPHLAVH